MKLLTAAECQQLVVRGYFELGASTVKRIGDQAALVPELVEAVQALLKAIESWPPSIRANDIAKGKARAILEKAGP